MHAKAGQMGGHGKKPAFHGLANSLVLSKVAAALGFTELKIALTGAAPIRTETLEYFGALGIQINECYGYANPAELNSHANTSARAYKETHTQKKE